MINFYKFYNKTGLDKEEYSPLIGKLSAHFAIFAESTYTTELEPIECIIKKSPRCAYLYARYVIKGRWPEAEPYIIKNPQWASNYARDVIKGRWIEAEPVIMTNAYFAYYYSRDIIKGRWHEAEPIIMTKLWWDDYCREFGI